MSVSLPLLSLSRLSTLLALAWVSRQVTPGGRDRRGWKGRRDIRYSGGMDRGTRGEGWPFGATLTWHVGRYQVLPRHRVDAERRRMCDRSPRPSFPSSITLFIPLVFGISLLSFTVLSTCRSFALSRFSLPSCARAAHTTLVSPRFCTRGDTPLP